MQVVNWQPKPNKLFKSIIDDANNIFSVDFANQLPVSSIILQPLIESKNDWNTIPDFMKYIPDEYLYSDYAIIFDSSAEAMCPIKEIKYWRSIEKACVQHNINPKRVIYLSCNLLDKTQAQNKKVPFQVYTEIFWQNYCLKEWQLENNVNKAFESSVAQTIHKHKHKYFSSLNKNNQRPARSYLHYQLLQKGLISCGLVSQNRIPQDQQKFFDFYVDDFNRELPLHIDRYSDTVGDNNGHNWIFDSTLFHITQESSQSLDHDKVLISEKFFKPIQNFTPQIVYGDPLVNRLYVVAQGFKTYKEYFDIALGAEWRTRADNIVKQTYNLCRQLDNMTHAQRIDWKYKDEQTLKHNYAVFLTNQFNQAQRKEFLNTFKI